MNRRNFIRFTMGALGSAMGISALKADVLSGVSGEMPKPSEELGWDCASKGTEGTVTELDESDLIKMISELSEELDKADVPKNNRYLADPYTGEIIHFENLVDPLTRKPLRIRRHNG